MQVVVGKLLITVLEACLEVVELFRPQRHQQRCRVAHRTIDEHAVARAKRRGGAAHVAERYSRDRLIGKRAHEFRVLTQFGRAMPRVESPQAITERAFLLRIEGNEAVDLPAHPQIEIVVGEAHCAAAGDGNRQRHRRQPPPR